MWDCGQFDKPIMTRWTSKPEAVKTYANARPFFEAKTASIESYKADSRKYASKNDYATANAALKISEYLKTAKSENEALAESLERNNAEHICAMKELQAEITQSKEEDQQNLWADINRLSSLVMQLTARLPKQKAEESPFVRFQEDKEESEDKAKPPSCPSKNSRRAKHTSQEWNMTRSGIM